MRVIRYEWLKKHLTGVISLRRQHLPSSGGGGADVENHGGLDTPGYVDFFAGELKTAGISEGMVRIHVGLEDPDNIIDGFKAVLDTLI